MFLASTPVLEVKTENNVSPFAPRMTTLEALSVDAEWIRFTFDLEELRFAAEGLLALLLRVPALDVKTEKSVSPLAPRMTMLEALSMDSEWIRFTFDLEELRFAAEGLLATVPAVVVVKEISVSPVDPRKTILLMLSVTESSPIRFTFDLDDSRFDADGPLALFAMAPALPVKTE